MQGEAASHRLSFGKHSGLPLSDVPEAYKRWLASDDGAGAISKWSSRPGLTEALHDLGYHRSKMPQPPSAPTPAPAPASASAPATAASQPHFERAARALPLLDQVG